MEQYDTNDKIPMIIMLIFVLIIAYFLAMSLGKSGTVFKGGGFDFSDGESSSTKKTIIGIVCAIIFIALALIIMYYVFEYNFIDELKSLFTDTKEVIQEQPTLEKILPTLSKPKSSSVKGKDQVFNVPGNLYGYTDAKAVCNAYGSRLANYTEVENAYKKGGEWCNYGWTDGQMALFPTQQKTYDVLQTKKGHENDCGRPGINGGYMANPKLKFGVNCYGKKPEITPKEADLMRDTTPYPLTMEDIEFQNKVDFWKDKVKDILVAPFNYKNWSA